MNCLLCRAENSEYMPLAPDGRSYLKCVICDFVWLDPGKRVSSVDEKSRYLEHNNSIEIPEYREYLLRFARPVLQHVSRGASGVDYGCGPVEGLKELLPEYRVEGFDPYFFPRALEGEHDFVLCCEVAEHFYSPREEFEKIHRLLRVGGVLGVSSWLLPPLEKFAGWSYRRDKTHVCFYAEKTVQWIARHYGFEILALDSPLWILKKV